MDSENIRSIDVSFDQRICDSQKHLAQGNGKMMKQLNSKDNIPRIGVRCHLYIADVQECIKKTSA